MEIAFKCPLCIEGNCEHRERAGTHIYACDACPFVAFEYLNRLDTLRLDMELDGNRILLESEREHIAQKLAEGYDGGVMVEPGRAWGVIVANAS